MLMQAGGLDGCHWPLPSHYSIVRQTPEPEPPLWRVSGKSLLESRASETARAWFSGSFRPVFCMLTL